MFEVITKPLDHQVQGSLFITRQKFAGLFMTMGTGKTLTALIGVCELKKKALVVCPPFLVQNWIREIRIHTKLTVGYNFQKFEEGYDIYIIPYTRLDKASEWFEKVDIVIADEMHYLKNLDAKRTQKFHVLMSDHTPEFFWGLTGTPLKNRIGEIYSFLLLLSKSPMTKTKITDRYKSFYLFANRFMNVKQQRIGGRMITKFDGAKNIEELRTYVNPYCFAKSINPADLPELQETSVTVNYDKDPELLKAFMDYCNGVGAVDIAMKCKSASAKAQYTAEYVKEIVDSEAGPVVVFSDHREPLNIMELHLAGYRVRQINGDVSMGKRDEYVQMLQKGQLDFLLCTIGAASVGYNMTAASTVVFNDISWVPGDNAQAIKRIHRIGSTKTCRVVYIVGSDADTYIIKTNKNKNKIIQGANFGNQ